MPSRWLRPDRPRNRPGFTIIELVIVLLMLGILAAIALPSYRKIVYRARAASIVHELHTIRNAAYQYEVENGAWPPDANRGDIPERFAPYLEGISFTGKGYLLDWDNWDPVFGISVVVQDQYLEAALLATLRTSEGTFTRLNDRYTYFVDASAAP